MPGTPKARGETEAQFQKAVIQYARLKGWRVHHARAAINRSGKWSTPIQGDPGFPDLVLARKGEVIFIELKTRIGRVSASQSLWLKEIGIGSYLFRPENWNEIKELLK